MFDAAPSNFATWRKQARNFIYHRIAPENIHWTTSKMPQLGLFNELPLPQVTSKFNLHVPKKFIALAERVAMHRDHNRWDLLYRLLWRITQGEKHLLEVSTDLLMHKLLLMQKAVGRDAHKMKAFVRFRQVTSTAGQADYLAWYQPDHYIVRLVAPFFQRRFSVMKWGILTPEESVFWDGNELSFTDGVPISQAPHPDQLEELWRTYYRATFNPARIKIKAMKREMPTRFWPHLPEAQIITELLHKAPARVETMLQHQEGPKLSAAHFLPKEISLATLRDAAKHCQACSLHCKATQTVFGLGSETAKIILIGEQPGDEEDRRNEPFVGPAGQLLQQILSEVEIARETIYLTNAVKHFKFKLSNNRRLHVTANAKEISACKPWLQAEIQTIKPHVIICLGVTATRAVLGHSSILQNMRGKWHTSEWGTPIMVTYHPSAVLRMTDPKLQQEIYQFIVQDLRLACSLP